jgi:hypothetical protein
LLANQTGLHLIYNRPDEFEFEVVGIRANAAENVKKATIDNFKLDKKPFSYTLSIAKPIDGPQEIEILIFIKSYSLDGHLQEFNGHSYTFVVSKYNHMGYTTYYVSRN